MLFRSRMAEGNCGLCRSLFGGQRPRSGRGKKYYPVVRVRGDRLTDIKPGMEDPSLVHSFGLALETKFDDVKALVDNAVKSRQWLTLMIHGVAPADRTEKRYNDINESLLEDVLRYISDLGPEKILPVNFSDVIKIRAQSPQPG